VQAVREAHKRFTERAAEITEKSFSGLDEERKAALEENRINVVRNIEWDRAPYDAFEEKTRELEQLYVANHIAKHPDKPCFGYRPPKPADEESSQADAAKSKAKRPRVIKPAVVPHTDGDKGPAEGSAL
jgi:hypothetical protein